MEVYIQEISLQFMMHLASQRVEILTLAIYSMHSSVYGYQFQEAVGRAYSSEHIFFRAT